MAKGGYPKSISKMRKLRTAGFNRQYFGEIFCVYSLLERFDMFAKIDNYRSTIEKIHCRQADNLIVFKV